MKELTITLNHETLEFSIYVTMLNGDIIAENQVDKVRAHDLINVYSKKDDFDGGIVYDCPHTRYIFIPKGGAR